MMVGMLEVLIAIVFVGFFIAVCVRHFFIQLIAIKLLIDTILLLTSVARTSGANPFHGQAVGILFASTGLLMFFVLMASGIKRFAKSPNENLEVKLD